MHLYPQKWSFHITRFYEYIQVHIYVAEEIYFLCNLHAVCIVL